MARADVSAVFVAVANDEALEILVHRERRDQLRLRAGFEAKMKFLAGVDDLFDHLAQLVHLDREDAAVVVAETEFVDRALEGAVDGFNAMPQQILKTNHERKSEAARPRFLHDFENVDRSAALLQRPHFDVARGVDREVAGAPAIDIVGGDGRFDVPLGLRFFDHGGQGMRIFNQRREHASRVSKISRGAAAWPSACHSFRP